MSQKAANYQQHFTNTRLTGVLQVRDTRFPTVLRSIPTFQVFGTLQCSARFLASGIFDR